MPDPGGNVTGITILSPDESAKRLQLLREVVPAASRVAFLWNPSNDSNVAQLEELQLAAPRLGIQLIAVAARTPDELDGAFAVMINSHADAFLMTGDPVHQRQIPQIVDLALKDRFPSMFLINKGECFGWRIHVLRR